MGGGYTHTADETAPGGPQPGLAGKTKCAIPSVGKSDHAAREDVSFSFFFLGGRTHGTKACIMHA